MCACARVFWLSILCRSNTVIFFTYCCTGGSFMFEIEERRRTITQCVTGERREQVKGRNELREG